MCQANICETALLQGQRILISHTVYKTLIHPLCSSSACNERMIASFYTAGKTDFRYCANNLAFRLGIHKIKVLSNKPHFKSLLKCKWQCWIFNSWALDSQTVGKNSVPSNSRSTPGCESVWRQILVCCFHNGNSRAPSSGKLDIFRSSVSCTFLGGGIRVKPKLQAT